MSQVKKSIHVLLLLLTAVGTSLACESGYVVAAPARHVPVHHVSNAWQAPTICQTPTLGITGVSVQHYGVKIKSVKHGGLADRLHLECGDIILSLNGCRIRCLSDLKSAIQDAARNGGFVEMKIDNVRARQGLCADRFVTVRGQLSACHPEPFSSF